MSGLGRAFAQAQERYDWMPEPEGESEEAHGLRCAMDDAQALIGRAERALNGGDIDAATDLLKEAGVRLAAEVEEV